MWPFKKKKPPAPVAVEYMANQEQMFPRLAKPQVDVPPRPPVAPDVLSTLAQPPNTEQPPGNENPYLADARRVRDEHNAIQAAHSQQTMAQEQAQAQVQAQTRPPVQQQPVQQPQQQFKPVGDDIAALLGRKLTSSEISQLVAKGMDSFDISDIQSGVMPARLRKS